jgi:Protein of unknown function (DUF2510)
MLRGLVRERAPSGWYADPTRRYATRWWDGSHWRGWVNRRSAVEEDPIDPDAALPMPSRGIRGIAARQRAAAPGAGLAPPVRASPTPVTLRGTVRALFPTGWAEPLVGRATAASGCAVVLIGLGVAFTGVAFAGAFALVGASRDELLEWVLVPLLAGCVIVVAGAHVLAHASGSGFSPPALGAYMVGSLFALISVVALAGSRDTGTLLDLMLVALALLVAGAVFNHWRRSPRAY